VTSSKSFDSNQSLRLCFKDLRNNLPSLALAFYPAKTNIKNIKASIKASRVKALWEHICEEVTRTKLNIVRAIDDLMAESPTYE
jgi:hypothetical protein